MAGIKHKWTEQGIIIMLRRQVAGLTQEKDDMLRQHRRIPVGDETGRHMVSELGALRKTLDKIDHKTSTD
jgi:hypothetical protein